MDRTVNVPEIDVELCDGCGLCVIACSGGGIILEKGKARVLEFKSCDFCCVCEAVCPRHAVSCSYILVSGED